MSLTLSGTDLNRLQAAQQTLLSPLAYPDLTAWSAAVIQCIADLIGSDRITMLLPTAQRMLQQSHPVLEPYHEAIAGMITQGPTGVRFREQQLEDAFSARRRRGWAVWSNRMLEEAGGRPMDALDFFHEVVVPAGVAAGGGMTVDLADGQAVIATGPGQWPDEKWLDVLGLLVPAFRAGAAAAAALDGTPSPIPAALDSVSDGALVVDASGHEYYCNPALRQMLQGPGGHRLRKALRSAGRSLLLRDPQARIGSGGPLSATREVALPENLYVIRAALLPPDTFLPRPAALVLAERRTPRLPTREALVRRFALTHREAEVALLLARGLRNTDAAERLGISPYTVRTHVEHIFAKLGIRSRKALALRLLGDGDAGRDAAN